MSTQFDTGNTQLGAQTAAQRPRIWRTWAQLLGDAWAALRAGGLRILGLIMLFQALLLVVASPLIGWLFREALRANGMVGLDLGSLRLGGGFAVTLTLIVVIAVLAFWIVAVQFATIVILLRRSRLGLPLTARDVLRDLGLVARKLARPSSLPLVAYLFLLLPLTGFGFTTVLAQSISVPPFISGELMKGQVTSIIWALFILALVILGVRFSLTLPVFALTDATGGRAMRVSWRLTRGRAVVSLVLAVLAVLVAAAIATLALVIAAIVPTAVTDDVAAGASPAVAAFSLGAAQVAGLVLSSLVTALVAAVLVSFLVRFQDRLPADLRLHEPSAGSAPRVGRRPVAVIFTTACVVAAVALGAAAIPTMHRLSAHPDTLVLAHRGFSAGGVENTICGLEAADDAGADLVEMDVMQTADGQFVAMHDANLSRLSGRDVNVKDLTLAEITAMTVSAQGHECAVPSFADYVLRAAELELPLLIEIKLGGADTPDHVQRLIDELESLQPADGVSALERNIYHSLDAPSVAELKHLRPDLTVGYTMAFAGAGAPDTPADFVVVEEWSSNEDLQHDVEAAGLGFMVWTVNEDAGMREYLRRNVDGIVTDHPDLAIAARTEIQQQTGLADTLVDALTRFVVVF